MVQSPFWTANWFAASQEIPRISQNPNVHYRNHKLPPPFSILGQPNPVHIPTSHLLQIHPNIIHPSLPAAQCFPWKHPLPPGDPSGGVVYLRTVLSPEQASRMWVVLNNVFYREGLLAPRPTRKLEDHPSSVVRDCLFNLFAATPLIRGRSLYSTYHTYW